MRKMLWSILLPFVAFVSSSSGAQGAPAVPELPGLILNNFSPGIREQIEAAYSYASSHATDATASGQLGMVL